MVGYLMRADVHPDGVVISTGTCLVPPAPFTLEAGDVVKIDIEEIGTLTTSVARGMPLAAPGSDARAGSDELGKDDRHGA